MKPVRADTMRLPVKVHCTMKQPPPWQDEWSVSMDAIALVQLSGELLSLPEPLPPRLRQLRRLIENVVSRGLETHPADWDHGLDQHTMAVE